MRVSFSPPSVDDYDSLFSNNISGGGLKDIRVYQPSYNARGGSLLGFIGTIAKKTIPFFQKLILPALGSFAKDLTEDVSRGTPVKQSFKRNAKKAGKKLLKNIGVGAGRKHMHKTRVYKKKKCRDIFG